MGTYDKDQPAIERGRRLGDFLVEGQRRRLARGVGVAPLAAAQKMLLAVGDSWFAYWPRGDVLDVLERKFHYTVDSRARAGSTLAEMVFEVPPGDVLPDLDDTTRGEQLKWLTARIQGLSPDEKSSLKAILLSGGGNDVVGDKQTLKSMIHPAAEGHAQPVKEEMLLKIVDGRLRELLTVMLSAISTVSLASVGRKVPILIHGYDYPVPDGRGVFLNVWLKPGLVELGYDALEDRKKILKTLIDRLNAMQIALLQNPEFQHVLHANLRGTLSTLDADYQEFWQNELHPTIPTGFGLVADKVAAKIPV